MRTTIWVVARTYDDFTSVGLTRVRLFMNSYDAFTEVANIPADNLRVCDCDLFNSDNRDGLRDNLTVVFPAQAIG
jgi:hypothetical protein